MMGTGIDWQTLWLEKRRERTWQGKTPADWNRRAAGFARRNSRSPFVDALLGRLDLCGDLRILDAGSGPGTLAIPLAGSVQSVTALDFSGEMLAILRQRCADQKINNITTVQASWDDDWQAHGLEPHDVVLVSRSLSVDNLQGALEKINRWATKRAIVVDRVGSGPFDPKIFAAVGRKFEPGPDYIFTINMLYEMGIHARLDFLQYSASTSAYDSRQEAVDALIWMLDELSAAEKQRFDEYMNQTLVCNDQGKWIYTGYQAPQWAVIQWEPDLS